MKYSLVYLLLLVSLCAACAQTQGSSALEPLTVTGLVLDTQGQPLENAKITVLPELFDGNVKTLTGADGRYRISSLADTNYKANAYIEVPYNEQTVCQKLAMTNADETLSFTVKEGAERNFQWQLTGQGGDTFIGEKTFFGAEITFNNIPQAYREQARAAEITLTPTGPLLDGSEGSVIVREHLFNETYKMEDIPLGPYTIQAVLLGNDGSRKQLGISTKGDSGTEADTNSLELAIDWESWGSCGGNGSGVKALQLWLSDPN